MECPFCSFENIEGVDECARCQADLSHVSSSDLPSYIERDLLKRPIGDLITKNYVEVPPDRSVKEVLQGWADAREHCMVITENGAVVGIFTERDVLNKLGGQLDEQVAKKPVREFMTADPETLDHAVPVAFGLNRMMVGGYRHIPIERDGALVGIVSVRDILGYLAEHFCEVAQTQPSEESVGS